MTPPVTPPPRNPRTAFAIVGFLAGIVTVVLVVLLVQRLRGG